MQNLLLPEKEIILPENEIWLGETVWNTNQEEQLAHLITEALAQKIPDNERKVVDGIHVLGIMEGCYFVPGKKDGAGGFSENGRNYPYECWGGETGALYSKYLTEKLNTKTFFGALGHEDKEIDETDIEKGKHAINTYKLWIDENLGLGFGRSYILNTRAGWNLFTAMKSGSTFKMSTRSRGSFLEGKFRLDENGIRQPVVNPKTFRCMGIDVVFNPGFKQTSTILKENKEKNVIEVIRSNNKMDPEKIAQLELEKVKAVSSMNEALTENASLKASVTEKETVIKSLNEVKEKTAFVDNMSESAIDVVKSFSKSDWETLLLTSKVKVIGESKNITHKKNQFHYDSLFIPIALPLITEARVKAVLAAEKIFENNPVEVSVINKTDTPEFGTNGLVLCWTGTKPANLQESLKKFLANSSLFEKDKEIVDDTEDEENADNPKNGNSKEDKNMKQKPIKEKHADEETEDDEDNDSEEEDDKKMSKGQKQELEEWQRLSEGASPYEFKAELKVLVETMTFIKNLINETGVSLNEEKASLKDLISTVFYEHQSFVATGGSVENIARLNSMFESVTNLIPDATPQMICEELEAAKTFYEMFKQKYISVEKLDEALIKSRDEIKALRAQSSKGPNNSKELVENDAQRISNELNGQMSLNETLKVLEDYKGNVQLAEERVFKHLRSNTSNSKKENEQNLNESKDPVGSNVRRDYMPKTGSLLGGYYDSIESGFLTGPRQ